jgi:hypothetical protein
MKSNASWAFIGALIFGLGWWASDSYHSQKRSAVTDQRTMFQSSITATERSDKGAAFSVNSVRSRVAVEALMQAIQQSAPERSLALIDSLESLALEDFSPALWSAFEQIMNDAHIEECHYLLSIMEQREELAAVKFLLKHLKHPDEDIRDRVLFACESVAGQLFSSQEEVQAWAQEWQPDIDRQRLFLQRQQDQSAPSARPIGPSVDKKILRNPERSAEDQTK